MFFYRFRTQAKLTSPGMSVSAQTKRLTRLIRKQGIEFWRRLAKRYPSGIGRHLSTANTTTFSAILWGYFPVVLVALVGLSISIAVLIQSLNWERRQVEIAFHEAAQDRILLIQREVKFSLGIIRDIASFFEASETVGRREFRKFVGPALKNHAGIKALAWVPRVPSKDYAPFLDRARKSFPPYQIKEPGDKGELIESRKRPVHYPILYVQPYQDNKRMLGLDMGIDEQVMTLFQQSVVNQNLQISSGPPGRTSITVAVPVLFKDETKQNRSDSKTEPRGFALGIFYLDEIVERALETLRPGSVDIHFYQGEKGAEGTHLYTHISRVRLQSDGSDKDYKHSEIAYNQLISVENQVWSVLCRPASDRFEAQTYNSWIIFFGGIAFTALLTIYTANLVGRARQVRLEVEERTAQLWATVEELNQEVMERKTAESELQTLNETLEHHIAHRTAEAERRAEYLEQFAYVTSHDLKAPLRAVSNLAEWIEEDLDDKLDSSSREQLSLLRDRVRRMHDLIEGLLEYSRVGKTSDTETLIDTRELIHEITDSLSPPKGFTIKIKGDMPVLMADRLQLGQVFSNLISNSLKYHGGKKGKIRITSDNFGAICQFTVCDDGQGIAPEYHDKVFKMFQTLESSDYGNSTGIGLALVKKIVVEHGGSIRLKSAVGKGACFSFTWPFKDAGD